MKLCRNLQLIERTEKGDGGGESEWVRGGGGDSERPEECVCERGGENGL